MYAHKSLIASTFALIICCGIVTISLCNIKVFTSIQSCIKFSPRSFTYKVLSSTSQRLSVVLRSGLSGGQAICDLHLMLSGPLFAQNDNLSLMNPGIAIFKYAIRKDKKKKSIDGKKRSFSI